MSVKQKVLVVLQNQQKRTPARFDYCIFKQLGLSGPESKVCCSLTENQLRLWCPPKAGYDTAYPLYHPSTCPLLHLLEEDRALIESRFLSGGIQLGVSVILETSDKHILLTRRAQHMRTFPGIWVPPGGHVELDEDLLTAGLRELNEETGLVVGKDCTEDSDILGIFESTFPHLNSIGVPCRHHIVVYLVLQLQHTKDQIKEQINLNIDETDAYAWISQHSAETIVNGENFNDYDEPEVVDAPCLRSNKKSMFSDHYVSGGTRYALRLWLRKQGSETQQIVSHL